MDIKKIEGAYEVLEEREVSDLHSYGYRLRHKKTGARFMLLENDDRNKVFAIAFRTPPEDLSGAPHIMEHSVLCGSRKFPVKDPFIELAKGSLNTFLNAMTYPDKTVYPVASTNEKDFHNLVDVYMDAVFHPNIYEREEIFKQEGWHYEINSPEEPITVNGVVYNEMKGAYSSPDDVLSREINKSLFPDTQYGMESGGDPEYIPELTYEKFKALHKKYYHPSNSYIYLYGDADMAEMLDFLDREYLSGYEKEEIDSSVKAQEPFKEQNFVEKTYPVTDEEPLEKNTFLSENFVISYNLDPELYIAFQILEYALLDVPGAPLTQTLINKGIGKDIEGSYDNGIYQSVFSIIARNSDPEQLDEFLSTIREVLENEAKNGIDKKALMAAINFHEFRYREADFGQYPKGLMYGLQSLDSWLYDDDRPFIHIESNSIYEKLRKNAESGYFEDLIKKYLLDNSFSSVVILKPEKGLTAIRDRKSEEKLKAFKDTLSDKEIADLISDTADLKKYQSEPSTEEELLSIPVLEISDIGKEAEGLDNEVETEDGVRYLFHDIYTNGISYLTFSFDLTGIPRELLPYAGIFKSLLGLLSTEHYSYMELNNEINLQSGGIDFGITVVKSLKEEKAFLPLLDIKGRFLKDKTGFAFDIIPEILFTGKLDDKKRVREVISMMVSRMADRLISSGHSTAVLRAMSSFSAAEEYLDMVNGVAFYDVIKDIEENFDDRFDDLLNKLTKVRDLILRKDRLSFDLTGDRETLQLVKSRGAGFAGSLSSEKSDMTVPPFTGKHVKEGIKTASQVQYVAKAADTRSAGLKYTGALKVLKVILGYDYLWTNVRVKGGAYGCMSLFSRNGDGYMASYRDPNTVNTLNVFNGAADYIRNFDASDRDMTKYVIGAVSDLDMPLTPKAKGARSRAAFLSGLTFEDIQRERDEVLSCDRSAIRALAPFAECIRDSENICILGAEERISEDKELFTEIRTLS